jgi:hypothetical protein
VDLWDEHHDQTVWSYLSPGYKHKSSVEHDGELRTHRQEQWIDAGLGDEYFNCVVTITEDEHHFVKAAVIFQCFKTRYEVRIRVTTVIEEVGQNGKADFFFYVR